MALPPDEPNTEEALEKEPEDGETPFRPADAGDVRSDAGDHDLGREAAEARLDSTHPDTDAELEDQDLYDAGVSGAADAEEPNAGNTVEGYDPTKDQRRHGRDSQSG